MIVAGIDPGQTGALGILTSDQFGYVVRIPMIKEPKNTPAWGEWWQTWNAALAFGIDLIVIERVASRPGQGVSSVFKFGNTYGFARALAHSAGAPIHYVTPAVWKAKHGLIGADKSASREKARMLFPDLAPEFKRVKDDGAAEALLLAYYGRKYL